MSVDVERLEHNMAKLTITVPAETFDKAVTEAYKKMKNRIAVPGFRKGKVPQAVVEKMYGPDMFYEDAANRVIPDAYGQAADELKDLTITSEPQLDIVQIGKGQEFIFTAEVALKPEVKLGEYKGISVPVEPVEVSDEEIEEELKREQEKNKREIPEEKEAEKDDVVNIDYKGTVNGVEFDGGSADGYDLKLGSGSFIPGFEDQLIGVKPGDQKEVNVTFPSDYYAQDLAGKDAVFNVKVNQVKVVKLPILDDEFAQDISEECDTLDDLKEKVIRKRIADRKQESADRDKQEHVMENIVANAEMDIPEAMILTQARQMTDRFGQQLQMQGINLETYLQYMGVTREDYDKQMEPQAKHNIENRLVLEAIADAENIEAGDEDKQKEFEKMAQMYNMKVEDITKMFTDSEDEMDALIQDIRVNKALDIVTEAAVGVPVEKVEASVDEEAAPEE